MNPIVIVCVGWLIAGVLIFIDRAVRDLRHRGEMADPDE